MGWFPVLVINNSTSHHVHIGLSISVSNHMNGRRNIFTETASDFAWIWARMGTTLKYFYLLLYKEATVIKLSLFIVAVENFELKESQTNQGVVAAALW